MASCPGGIERSPKFNKTFSETGLATIPQVVEEAINDQDGPFYMKKPGGVALVDLIEVLHDPSTTITDEGICAPSFFDKPIKHLELVVNPDTFELVNRIGKRLRKMAKGNLPIPVTVDVILEYDVQKFYAETDKFIEQHKLSK